MLLKAILLQRNAQLNFLVYLIGIFSDCTLLLYFLGVISLAGVEYANSPRGSKQFHGICESLQSVRKRDG
jgi:hypothetical protein